MSDDHRADRLDELFRLARLGEPGRVCGMDGGLVEIPLRRSLRRFARAVDVEVSVQETLARMCDVAHDSSPGLEGERRLAQSRISGWRGMWLCKETRRSAIDLFVDLGKLEICGRRSIPNPAIPPWPGRSMTASNACLLSPLSVLAARLEGDCLPDRVLAEGLRMRLNTFLQNIVRARKSLEKCLEGRGVRLRETPLSLPTSRKTCSSTRGGFGLPGKRNSRGRVRPSPALAGSAAGRPRSAVRKTVQLRQGLSFE